MSYFVEFMIPVGGSTTPANVVVTGDDDTGYVCALVLAFEIPTVLPDAHPYSLIQPTNVYVQIFDDPDDPCPPLDPTTWPSPGTLLRGWPNYTYQFDEVDGAVADDSTANYIGAWAIFADDPTPHCSGLVEFLGTNSDSEQTDCDTILPPVHDPRGRKKKPKPKKPTKAKVTLKPKPKAKKGRAK